MKPEIYNAYVKILHEELVPAMGCTEPIAIAYASALARDTLGTMPERMEVQASGNLIKNVKSVVVPNTNGLKGIEAAVAAGVVAGDAGKALEVISVVSGEQKARIQDMVGRGMCKVSLLDSGLVLECKPFSVGFRAEHLQSEIEKSLYHEAAGHPALPRGEYQLSQHVGERCVYTFCMCPGGQVVASASEKGRVVTNGMSYHARSGKNANAAVVVSVGGADFANDPRQAIAFQRELEARAYAAGRPAGEYAAPAESIQSFLEGRGQLKISRVQPTYDRGVCPADLGALLPGELADTLRAGLRAYERKIAGYTAPEAILTGLETRTSSPVRLKREENFECAQLAGLYPCGEGAGYAGGIMSAAVDGLRVARAIISRYSPAEG